MATNEVKRKLTAIFSADVEGYSRLMEEDELATVETLTSHKQTMRKLIKQYRGRVVDSTGDNLLAEFGSVVDAVQCAVEVQQVLGAKNESLPENRRMNFRIGINSGDVIEEGERIYGDGINVAARVESLALGGGISLSGTAFDQLGKKLPLGYEYVGEQTVKNISKPVRVYRVLTEAEAVGQVIGDERPRPRKWPRSAIASVAILFILAGAFAVWNFYVRPDFEPASVEKMLFPLPDKPSIAVLPFENISGDPDQEFICDGLSENIIRALSRIPEMFVIARNSTFTYKGTPVKVQQVAEELGVQYVLEGSVQKSGDKLRVTAQLIDALKGHHLWSEKYDRKMKDFFDLQDEITKKIITALRIQLSGGEQAGVYASGTDNLEAYLKTMEADWLEKQSHKKGVLKAQKLAEEAIAIDPEYAFAYKVLGSSHTVTVQLGMSKNPRESLKKAFGCFRKAIKLDDSLAQAHASLGVWSLYAKQYDTALTETKRAIELEPNLPDAIICYAIVKTFLGNPEEAIPFFKDALRLNPIPPAAYYRTYAIALRDSGQYEEAIAEAKKAVAQGPNDLISWAVLVSSLSLGGHEEEAREGAKEILRLRPNFSVASYEKRSPHKNRAMAKRYCDALRKAGLPE